MAGLESIAKRWISRAGIASALALGAFGYGPDTSQIAYAEPEVKATLRSDLEKMLGEDPGLVEQARQRIYDELGGAKAPQTLGSKKMRVSLLLDTLKGIGKQANLEVDSKLYSALGDRLKRIDGKESHPMLLPGETSLREMEHIVFTLYDHLRQEIRLRQLGITPESMKARGLDYDKLMSEFVFVPRGYYTIGEAPEKVDQYLDNLRKTVPPGQLREKFHNAMKPDQSIRLEDFFISITQVTQAQMYEFMQTAEGKEGGKVLPAEGAEKVGTFSYLDRKICSELFEMFPWKKGQPVEGAGTYPMLTTNIKSMEAFAQWWGKMLTGYGGRLADTIEWEAAGRGSTRDIFAFGNEYAPHWEHRGGTKSGQILENWTANYDMARDTSHVSTLGAKFVGTVAEIVRNVARDRYGVREHVWIESYGQRGVNFGAVSDFPGATELVSAMFPSENRDVDAIIVGAGFRVLIPAENLRDPSLNAQQALKTENQNPK
ncbi:MAG: SUMF1/EgtB/PvdO family nonheme iron enzyme [Nanoarchaeota archaeon]|nr:SUMF1/EgtB/PvdO family nonheme iron enzyme [Nanoarchaeota archaeon]